MMKTTKMLWGRRTAGSGQSAMRGLGLVPLNYLAVVPGSESGSGAMLLAGCGGRTRRAWRRVVRFRRSIIPHRARGTGARTNLLRGRGRAVREGHLLPVCGHADTVAVQYQRRIEL
jgi:hypothetical protein